MKSEMKKLRKERQLFFAQLITLLGLFISIALGFLIDYIVNGATDPQTASVISSLIAFMFIVSFVFGVSFTVCQGWVVITDED